MHVLIDVLGIIVGGLVCVVLFLVDLVFWGDDVREL